MSNIRHKKELKKFLTFIFVLITLFSTAQPILAVSSSGTGKWVAGQWDSEIYTTDNNSNVGILLRRLVNYTTGERITVFCGEHGMECETGTIETAEHSVPTAPNTKEACKVAYFGWYSKYGKYVIDAEMTSESMKQRKLDYVFTQQMIWEKLGQSNATFTDSNIQNQYNLFRSDINTKINNMKKQPSFVNDTITIEVGETKTITDSNNVLKDYVSFDKTVDGIRILHTKGENTLTITVDKNCTKEKYIITESTMKEWGIIKEETADNDTTVFFTFREGVQDQLYALNYNDPVTMLLDLQINLFGNLELSKLDEENNLIDGAEFRITGPNNFNKLVTVTNGKIKLDNMKKGSYTIKEEKAPEGYLLNPEIYKVEIRQNEVSTQAIVNSEPTGVISIIKKDIETGSKPQGDATFVDATYKVYATEDIYNKAKTKKFYSKGDLVATRTMNENGKTEDIRNLPLGKYTVKETASSKGYLLDKDEHIVNLEYKDQKTKVISNSITSYEVVKKMQVHIFKSGIKEVSGLIYGLDGAEFTIKLNSDVENAYKQGYSYEEIWNGIDEYGNKVDVDKNRVAQAQKIAPTYSKMTTNKGGNAYTEQKLPYGKYVVKETKTPKDYESASDFYFSITQDESEIKETSQKAKHLVVNNRQLETYIKLIKKDLTSGKTITLNSATFEIKATKDIYDRANGKLLYKKGETVKQKVGSTTCDTFTTNADNIVIPENSYNSKNDDKGTVTTPLMLEVGSYEITEIKTPNGFLQLDKPVTFKVDGIRDYDKDEDGNYIQTIEIKNDKPLGTLIVDKSISVRKDVDRSLVNISDLSKIQFRLTAKENIINTVDGSIIYKKGEEIKTYNLDKNGDLKIEKLPLGIYELQEVKTLDGLVLNTTKYEVKFTQKDFITKVYKVEKNIKNDTTVVEFSKKDITAGDELLGAKLSVIDEKNNVIDTWTSSKKTHKIEGLTVGKTYTLREDLAPLGYAKSTDIKFEVKNTTEIQKVTMIDKIVEMSKVDIAGNEIEGAELRVVSKDGKVVDSWTSTKEIHKIKGLTEGERYTLYEDYAPDGFVISNKVEFTVTKDKKTQKIEMIDKIVEVSKIDIAGEELEGATLVMTNTKTKNIVDKWVSTKEPHKISGLIEGETYLLHEEIVIDGYVKATDIEFTVTEEKETQNIKMIDKIVEVLKTDITTGEELEGAELKVADEDGNVIDEWISTKEPHKITGLEENKTYKLIETTAPYGYEIAEEIEFTVTEDKETQKVEMQDMPILQDIKLVKVDTNTNEVIKSKFTFGIYEDVECTNLIKEVKSDKKEGTVLFEDLRYGTYYIKELTAPKGYVLSDKIVKVEMNDKGVFIDDAKVEGEDLIYTFEFYNAPIDTPKTGDNSNMPIWIAILSISAIALTGIRVYKLKKKKTNSK